MTRHAWGIDVGDGTLKAVRIRKARNQLEVVRVVEIPYFDPFVAGKTRVTPIDRRALAALIQLGNSVKIPENDSVAIGFPSFNTFEGFVNPPRVDENELERIVSFEVASMTSLPAEELDIRFRVHESRSQDTHRVQALVMVKKETERFSGQIAEAGLAWDQLVSSAGALYYMLRISHPTPGDFVVVSPGLAATSILLVQRSQFWARTLPVGLPLPPGESADMARDKMVALAVRLEKEIKQFTRSAFVRRRFKPRKILVSGEGARIPSFLNALDARMTQAVEVLRAGPGLAIDPEKHRLPPAETVSSMGKAIGLAVGALTENPVQLTVMKPVRTRQVLKILPTLTLVTFLLLLTAVGFKSVEMYRARELKHMTGRLDKIIPPELAQKVERAEAGVRLLENELYFMADAAWETLIARIPGRIVSRFENQSKRGTYGDYHLVELVISSRDDGERELQAVVATRITSETAVTNELNALFGAFLKEPNLSGSLPSGEVNPLENLSPLEHYRINGVLKKPR